MDDSIPEDEEITWELRRLILTCLGVPSGMRAEHLCQWLIAETRDDSPDTTNWLNVVAIVQAAFQDGTLAEELKCKTVIFITKWKGDLRGIGLIEVI